MQPLPDMIVTTVALVMLLAMSVRNFLFWQRQPGVRRLPVQAIEIGIGGTIFLLLNLSVLFFNDSFSRPAVALVAAGTYYCFARLCAGVGRSLWRHRRLHTIALAGLCVAAVVLAFSPISTPLIVLTFALASHWEQWRFTDVLVRESNTDLHCLQTKIRTIVANNQNASIIENLDAEVDSLDNAG